MIPWETPRSLTAVSSVLIFVGSAVFAILCDIVLAVCFRRLPRRVASSPPETTAAPPSALRQTILRAARHAGDLDTFSDRADSLDQQSASGGIVCRGGLRLCSSLVSIWLATSFVERRKQGDDS